MKRPFVLKLFQRVKEKPRFIQVVLGPRQVGKTTGILQLKEMLPDCHFIFTNSDSVFSSKAEWLKSVWLEARIALESHDNVILAIDEVQNIPDWSAIIKGLWDSDKIKKNKFHVILLGSSSLELHQGLSESLAGRFEYVYVPHWNYSESKELSPTLSLEDYMEFGGYPEPLLIDDLNRRNDYLRNSIIEPVISTDILQNVTVKKPALFRQTFEIACLHASEVLSLNKFLGQLQEGGNVDLVKYYLSLYEKAFLIKTLEKYSTNRLQKKASSPKFMPQAPIFLTLFGDRDKGRKFELIVGLHLINTYKDVFYWREGNHEVDFVIKHERKVIGIEVKSGRKKLAPGLTAFTKKFKAHSIIINPENFHNIDAMIKNC